MDKAFISRISLPFGTALISFLAFSSQWLFHYIEPGPLSKGDTYIFNVLVAGCLVGHFRTCFTDPGKVPQDWHEKLTGNTKVTDDAQASQRQRWCRKCEAFKPPRAHHCKTCKRCVMKMDHHCLWTANCVSHITIPHFIRFLFYGVTAMIYLQCFLYTRCAVLWEKRHLPSYLGPTVSQLVLLFVLVVVNSTLLFALFLLLARTIWSLALNMTTIEGWEVERHEALLRRARVTGGYLNGPDGSKIRLERQEFPWDVGIWSNLCQGMGSRNPLSWFWPFARSPSVESGLGFEHNGIDDPSKPWPPPDPDRMMRATRTPIAGDGFTQPWDIDSFRARQAADLARYEDADGEYVVRRRPFHERLEDAHKCHEDRVYEIEDEDEDVLVSDDEESAEMVPAQTEGNDAGEEGWRNKEGERLADFGVDEVAEFYDEDDVPLAELIRRRKARQDREQ